MDEREYQLLKSIEEHPRQLSMSKSPVPAIEIAFKFMELGLVGWMQSEYHSDLIIATDKGKQALREYEIKNPPTRS